MKRNLQRFVYNMSKKRENCDVKIIMFHNVNRKRERDQQLDVQYI